MRTIYVFGLSVLLYTGIGCAESVEFQISSGNDDAYSDISGTKFVSDNEVLQGNGFGNPPTVAYHSGYRFSSVNLYRGQKINSASLQLFITGRFAQVSGTDLYIYGDTTDNSPDFSGANPGPDQRLLNSATSGSKSWYFVNPSMGWHSSPDLKPVIDELINAPGWDAGDPLSLSLKASLEYVAGYHASRSYEGDPQEAAKLVIDFVPNEFEVLAGATGEFVLGESGATLIVSSGSVETLNLVVARNNSDPEGTFSGTTATSSDGTPISADVHSNSTYWSITASGDQTGLTYSISLDATGHPGMPSPDKVVILKRDNSSSSWVALNTTRNASVFTASGLTSFSEFTLGSNSAFNALPVNVSGFSLE